MPLVSRDRFAAACRDADPGTVAAFVADLYAARGYDVERQDDGLLRLHPGSRTLAVQPTDAADVPPDVDAIVTVEAGTVTDPDLDVVDADALYEQIAYALDRSVARDLLGRHFGSAVGRHGFDRQGEPGDAGPTEDSTPTGMATDQSAGETPLDERNERNGHGATSVGPRAWRRSRLTAVLAVAGMVLLVGVLAAGMPVQSPDIGDSDRAVSAETPSPTPAGTPTTSGDRNGAAIATGKSSAERTSQDSLDVAYSRVTGERPPGIGADGLANIDALIATHRSVLSNTSFTVRVQYREFEDGRVTGAFVETVRVESRDRYSVSVAETGTLQTSPRAIVGADAFSNGNRTWVRPGPGEAYVRSRLSTSRMLGQLARYLRWSLSVEESTLHGQPTDDSGTYWIRTDGDPYQGIRDASGTVHVTGEGVITYGRWTYATIRPEARVEFSVRTTGVGTTTVSRPGWVEDGTANGTGAERSG